MWNSKADLHQNKWSVPFPRRAINQWSSSSQRRSREITMTLKIRMIYSIPMKRPTRGRQRACRSSILLAFTLTVGSKTRRSMRCKSRKISSRAEISWVKPPLVAPMTTCLNRFTINPQTLKNNRLLEALMIIIQIKSSWLKWSNRWTSSG